MATAFETISNSIEEKGKNFTEVIKERLFSPMYFYFIISWVVTNWNFAYTLLFIDEEIVFKAKNILKVEFLLQFYKFDSFWAGMWSMSKLVVIPTISAFLAVWWLSKASEKFFKKNEEYKQNKRAIERGLKYAEDVKMVKEKIEIRNLEFNKNSIQYADNDEFNISIDEENGDVNVFGVIMRPSEVLYNNDYEAYKEELSLWQNEKFGKEADEIERQIVESNS